MRKFISLLACSVLSLSSWAQDTNRTDSLAFKGLRMPDVLVRQAGQTIMMDPVIIIGVLGGELGHKVEHSNKDLRLPSQSTSEVLEQRFSSVDIRSRSLNDVQSDISVRGSTFDQVLILVNGIPYSDPQTGHHSMNLPVPMEAIQAISVLPSGGSYRFGPFAFAGVVDIQTWSPEYKGGYAHAGIGQFGYQRGAAGLYLGQIAGTHVRMDMDYKAADGAINNTDFSQLQAYVRSQTILAGGRILQGHLGMVTKGFGAQNFYSFNFPEQYEAVAGFSAALDLNAFPWAAKIYARQHSDHFELFREDQGYYQRFENGQFMRTTDSSLAPSWYTEHNNHRTQTFGGEATYTINQYKRTIVGADIRHDGIVSSVLGTALLSPIPAPDNRSFYTRGDARNNAGIFASTRLTEPSKPFTLKADLRLNYNDRYGLDYLPNIEANYTLPSESSLKSDRFFASVNRSFRLPTFTDLYYTLGGAQGSPTLQPEYAWNMEAGTSIWRSPVNVTGGMSGMPHFIRATAYQRRGSNLIDWIYRTVDGAQILQADNITQVSIQGLELETGGSAVDLFTWDARFQAASHSASALDGQSIYALDYLSNRLQLSIKSAPMKGFQGGLVYIRQDRAGQYALPGGELTSYAPFQTVDARLSYDHDGMTVYLDAMNLFNASILDRGNVPLPGRWIKAGVHFHWD
ncbi:MAG: TonB-dependent receptor plug domain-containing protein [Schleiferiaceae bacterium]|nr:TonB-dependent receptor plug domain-containing protein [Schleiferiaceae bacterium]